MKKLIKLSIIFGLFSSPCIVHAKRDKLVLTLESLPKKSKKITTTDKDVIKTAKKYLGTRYKFGGTSKRGIDCSSFTQTVMKKVGKKIPRTASQQASSGKHIKKSQLKAGDLVFFKNTDRRKIISHVGIYIGNNKFIHASSGAKKVTISNLNKRFYKLHYAGARRV